MSNVAVNVLIEGLELPLAGCVEFLTRSTAEVSMSGNTYRLSLNSKIWDSAGVL
jgi:hypothetical protein